MIIRLTEQYHHPKEPFSNVLEKMAYSLPPEGMTLRVLLDRLRSQGLLALCMVLTVPFLLPVSIPGSSTPFGLVIALFGLGIVVGRPLQLPKRVADRPISSEHLYPVLQKGSWLFVRIEKFARFRLPLLTSAMIWNRIHALVMVFSAILLMAPLPIPFSNTIPAYGVLLLAAGSLERDGYLILSGYLMVVLSLGYFVLLGILGTAGVKALFFSFQ